MFTHAATFLTSLLVALVITPLIRRTALRFGAVSAPGGRNINKVEVPRLGGVAIALAAILPLCGLLVLETGASLAVQRQGLEMAGLAFGALLMCIIGAWDDIRGLRARHKLLAQVLVAGLAYATGFRIQAVALPVVGVWDMGVFALPVTLLWIVGIINAVNLIDGLDGLAAGVVFCAAGTTLVTASVGGMVFVASVMAALMGSLFGFLFFNFNPARIFMGDSGSYFLGYVLATASLIGNLKSSVTVSLLVPVLALGLPIFDTLFSLVRRAVEKQPLFAADRGHLHHRLLDLGFTHKRAVLTLYGLTLILTFSAIAVSLGRDWQLGFALVVALTIIAGLLRFASGFVVTSGSASRSPNQTPSRLVVRMRTQLPETLHRLTASPSKQQSTLDEFARHVGLGECQLVEAETAPMRRVRGMVQIQSKQQHRLLMQVTLPDEANISKPERALLELLLEVAALAQAPRQTGSAQPTSDSLAVQTN